MPFRSLVTTFLVLATLLIVTYLDYSPGLHGTFVFDDVANITANSQIAITRLDLDTLRAAALSGHSGPLQRPLSMLSFAGNYYAAGMDPYYFKLTNLAIHLCNGAGIFVLTWLLLSVYRRRLVHELSGSYVPWIALTVSAAWLLHPLNLTSVLYVVQRMTSLSAFFTIWGLVVFLWGRTRLYDGKSGIALISSSVLFTPLAALSKETGLLLPLFMLIAEVTLFSFETQRAGAKRFLIAFYALSVAVPALLALGYFATQPERLLAGYAIRDFTLPERLLTEARVLWFYMWQILVPSNAQLGLYHDDFAISRGWFQPVSTVLAVIGIAGLFAVALLLRKKAPMLAFGLLFFLAGHALESTIFPLEIAHEHRNYLPMYGIVLVVFYYLLHPLVQVKSLRARHVFAALLIGLFAIITYARASNWSNPYDQFQAEFLHHPDSAMVNVEMGAIYGNIVSPDADAMAKNYRMARGHYERAERLDGNDTKALFGLIILNAGRGMIVEPEWLKELGSRLERAPFAPISSDKLVELTRCELEGGCRLAYVELEGLLKSALRNPTLTGPSQAKVLFALSTYTINVLGDYPAALQLMHQMVDVAPQETASRIALINYLIALRRPDEAREQLNKLKEMKPGADKTAEILSIERELSGGDPDVATD